MELLDRYLEAVKKHLPWQRQDDIIAELRANLEAQLEEKEERLGRPLTVAEAEDWLKQLGAPIQMAAHYKPQQYLIGPAVFPIYWSVLKISFTWAMIIYLIVSAVEILSGTPSLRTVVEAVLRVPGILITTAAWVTLVFAAIEFAVTHSYVKLPATVAPSSAWSPGALPPLQVDTVDGKRPRSFAQVMIEAVLGFFFLAWLLLIPKHPWLLFGPGAAFLDTWGGHLSPFQLGPVWIQFYWWIVALNVLQVGWRCVDLLRGTWQKKRPALHLAMKAFGLIPIVLLLTVPNHATVLLKHPELDVAQYGVTLDTINLGINRAFLVILAIASVQLAWDIWRMGLKSWREREAAML